MIEILWLIFFTRKIRRTARDKGYKPGKYGVAAVVAWFGSEILGFIVGALFLGSGVVTYLVALAFAVVSAVIVNASVNRLPDQAPVGVSSVTEQQWQCPQCGAGNTSWDPKCVSCGIPKPTAQVAASAVESQTVGAR